MARPIKCYSCPEGGYRYDSIKHLNGKCDCGHIWGYHVPDTHSCARCDSIGCFPKIDSRGAIRKNTKFSYSCKCKACREFLWTKKHINRPNIITAGNDLIKINLSKLKLDKGLCLREAAADFYLLMEMEMEGVEPYSEIAGKRLKVLIAHLSEQLALYLEIACLGEYRYLLGEDFYREYCDFAAYSVKSGASETVHPILLEAMGGCNKEAVEVLRLLLPYIVKKSGHQLKLSSRESSWYSFKHLKDKMGGVEVLRGLASGFRDGPWLRGGSVGGIRWAICAEIALLYRDGKLSPLLFIDQAFGLKHNGNIAFDKFWDVSHLQEVLDYTREGKHDFVEHYASKEVIEMRFEWDEALKKLSSNVQTS